MNPVEPIVYLDNNATTALATECLDEIAYSLRDHFGNPSSKHQLGEAAKLQVISARSQVAALLGASPPEIVFTSSGTEAIHQAIVGALSITPEKPHIVTSVVEHPAQLALLSHLVSQGKRVTYLPVDSNGQISLDELRSAIQNDTAMVSLMWANNETGVVFPIAEAAQIAADKNVLFHTDAVQAVGKTRIDLTNIPIDFLSFSGHKIHAAKGIGALFIRKGRKLSPLLFGHQERGRRGGTENVLGIITLGIAAELASRALTNKDQAQEAYLRDRLEREISSRFPWILINGLGSQRLPNTSSICFDQFDADLIINKLDRAGICVSAGAACTATGTQPSHVLLAMGLTPMQAAATIRFSLSRYTTMAEISRALTVLVDIIVGLEKAAA